MIRNAGWCRCVFMPRSPALSASSRSSGSVKAACTDIGPSCTVIGSQRNSIGRGKEIVGKGMAFKIVNHNGYSANSRKPRR